jgi:hypothetical protein
MHDRSAAQVHVEKATLDAVLAGNLVDSGLGADLGEQVSEVIGLVRASGASSRVQQGRRRRDKKNHHGQESLRPMRCGIPIREFA